MRVAVSPARRNSRAHPASCRPSGGRVSLSVDRCRAFGPGEGPFTSARWRLAREAGAARRARERTRSPKQTPAPRRRHASGSALNLWSTLVKFSRCGRSVAAIYIAHVAADRIGWSRVQLLRDPAIGHTAPAFKPRCQRDLPRCGFRLSVQWNQGPLSPRAITLSHSGAVWMSHARLRAYPVTLGAPHPTH